MSEPVTAVVVMPDSAFLTLAGDTVRLVATALTARSDTARNVAFAWASTDSGVASISRTGLVTAGHPGSATITATAPGGASGGAAIAVSGLTVAVSPSRMRLRLLGDTVRLRATAYGPTGAVPGLTFTWESTAPSVVSVNQGGLATAMSVGSATITATSRQAGSASAAVEVPQQPTISDLVLTPEGVSLSGLGSRATIHALDRITQQPAAGTITWASLNPAVVAVDGSGTVTAVGVGQAAVSAVASGAPAYALVTVSAPEAVSVTHWTVVRPDTTLLLSNVWGAAPNDVYATATWYWPALLHFDGTTWSALVNPDSGALTAVGGVSAAQQFFIAEVPHLYGHYGWVSVYLVRRVGTAWAWGPVGSGNCDFTLWAATPRDVWVGQDPWCSGYRPFVVRMDGEALIPVTTFGQDTVYWDGVSRIWGTSASNIFGVSRSSFSILHGDPSGWSRLPTGVVAGFYGVWGTSPTSVYAVGDSGTIVHYDGAAWSPMVSGTTALLMAVWGLADTNVYAVGSRGTILHYDGVTWSPMSSGTTADLYDIWGTTPTTVFVVGSGGTILHGTP